jgi:RNA recognition motif-containing protein
VVIVGTKLFVGSLPWSVTDEFLHRTFEGHGKVVSAKVITDREMENSSDANSALTSLNNSEISGRKIVVNQATPRG